MKKTIALVTAIVLTLSIFMTDLVGIAMIVRAEDGYPEEEYYNEDADQTDDGDWGDDDWGDEDPADDPADEPADEPGDDDGQDAEEEKRREEEERKRAEEEEKERKRQEEEEEERKRAEEEEKERKRQEEEEKERERQEEEERKRQEEEEKKRAKEEEKERKRQEEEERKRAEEEEKERKRAEKEEQERQKAEEKAAKEAEEAAEKAREEKEAKEAQKRAEEEEKARKEAEKAAKEAAKEKKEAEAGSKYSLTATAGSSAVSAINFGSAQAGESRDVKTITISNTGDGAVDLIYTMSNDADGAFNLSLNGDPHLEPGQSASFNISMNAGLYVGKYKANATFADASRDPKYKKGITIPVSGTVTAHEERVTGVCISPSKLTMAVGGSAQFVATVSGNTDPLGKIKWTVAGNRSEKTKISKDGVLKVGKDETASSLSVIAASAVDTSVTDTASVKLERNCYNISVYADPARGGHVTGGGAVSEGDSVTMSAVPSENYAFDGWFSGNKRVSTATNYTVSNVKGDAEYVARFSRDYIRVRVESNNSDAGDVTGGGKVQYGGSTTISAKAYNGYVFTGWEEGGDIVSRDASIRLKDLTVDRKFTAIFSKTEYTVNVVGYPTEGGMVAGAGKFKLGSSAVIRAVPAAGFRFDGWQVNGQYVSRSAEFRIENVRQDYTFTAIFLRTTGVTYEIDSGVATTGGSISPSGKVNVLCGQSITYTITPKSGFAILAVAVDGVQVGPVSTYTFSNVQGPHMIAAAFLQTDAGKQAAEASGKNAQSRKVEPIEKTSKNTATSESTVELEEAAVGAGGDNYVVEMDLSDVDVPTDEELGIEAEDDDDTDSEVPEILGKSEDQVDQMISTGDTMSIVDAAFYSGYLATHVINALEPADMKSIDYNNLSREELMIAPRERINPSMPDLETVVSNMLSTDEIAKLARGERVDIAVSLTGQETVGSETGKIMRNAVGRKPVKFFDLTMLKTVDGFTERVTETPTTMEVIIEIPDDVYEKDKIYSILRVHDEELKVLPDLDDDPRTITFRTDRFSSYAIAKEVTSPNVIIAWLAAGAAIALILAITCFAILVAHQRKVRRLKRRAARERAMQKNV